MPGLNFKSKFAHAVEAGQKRQTIRQVRKHPIKVGDTLYLYTGMRTKACRKLAEEKCVAIEPIEIHPTYITVSGRVLNMRERHSLAVADGFTRLDQFYEFFISHYDMPFKGVVIKW